MTRAFRQRDIERALRAAKAVGYSRPAVEIMPDGVIRLLPDAPSTPEPSLSPLERWERANGHGPA